MAGGQDCHAMAAQVPAQQQLIARANRRGVDRRRRLHRPDATGGDKYAVGLAPFHHLGVAGNDRELAGSGRRSHRGHQAPQQRQRQALLQQQRHAQMQGPGAGHR